MMRSTPCHFALSPQFLRSVTVGGLLAAAVIAPPLSGAVAEDAAGSQSGTVKSSPRRAGASAGPESIDQRIAGLHKSLKITAEEESAWATVAQAMRDTESAMQKLVAANRVDHAKNVSAIEDLKIYASFTQAHVDGLKTLIPAFETLYASMPDPQKAVADQVFQRFGHKGNPSAKPQ